MNYTTAILVQPTFVIFVWIESESVQNTYLDDVRTEWANLVWKAVVDVPCNLQRVVDRLSVIND